MLVGHGARAFLTGAVFLKSRGLLVRKKTLQTEAPLNVISTSGDLCICYGVCLGETETESGSVYGPYFCRRWKFRVVPEIARPSFGA